MDELFELFNLDRNTVIARRIRVAGTSSQRRRGLLGVSALDGDAGLWICPCEAIHTFGMRIPLDVVFLDAASRVRKIRRGVARNRISLCLSARSVVEMSANNAGLLSTAVGDRLEFRKSS